MNYIYNLSQIQLNGYASVYNVFLTELEQPIIHWLNHVYCKED